MTMMNDEDDEYALDGSENSVNDKTAAQAQQTYHDPPPLKVRRFLRSSYKNLRYATAKEWCDIAHSKMINMRYLTVAVFGRLGLGSPLLAPPSSCF